MAGGDSKARSSPKDAEMSGSRMEPKAEDRRGGDGDRYGPSRHEEMKRHRDRSRSAERRRSRSRSRSESYGRPSVRHRRSHSRHRRSYSRSYSRSLSPRSRSRSPGGPVFRDMRRGRRPYRYKPRSGGGGRHYHRGSYVPHRRVHGRRRHSRSRSRSYSRSVSRSHSRSRSRGHQHAGESRSPSPRPPVTIRPIEPEEHGHSSDEEDVIAKKLTGPKKETVAAVTTIKEKQKEANQNFIAMLEEKKKKSKMIPIVITTPADQPSTEEGSQSPKVHGFVNTFTSNSATAEGQSKQNASEQQVSTAAADGQQNDAAPGVSDESESNKEPNQQSAEDEKDRTPSPTLGDGGDKKLTAKELLERKRAKLGDGMLSSSNGDNGSRFDPKALIGKVKMAKKSFVRRKEPGEGVNLNNDYVWYTSYYQTNYGLDAYSAAYSAYYTMVTSGDYTQKDIQDWMAQYGTEQPVQQGYLIDYSQFGYIYEQQQLNATVTESPATATAETNGSTDQAAEHPISTTVTDVPVASKEMFFIDNQNTSMDLDDEEMEVESNCATPPPPGTPPSPPKVTMAITNQDLTLPDGTVVPAGTRQTIVHPTSIECNQ